MKPLVKQLKEQGFRIRVIDVSRNPRKATAAGINAIPTFIHYHNGQETQRFSGAASHRTLKNCFRPT